MTPIRTHHLIKKKQAKTPITMLTAYDFTTASLLDQAGIDMLLVGDSVGNVFGGKSDTLSVTLEEIIYHSTCVSRGSKHSMVVADLPFMSYQVSSEQARESAGRLIKEGHAHAVKAEVSPAQVDLVKAMIDCGIPVMGHIGFTPQHIHQLGGYKIQGKTTEAAEGLLALATTLESIGCFSVLLEMVPAELAKNITDALEIPTIGIGAGPYCDGQVLVTQDLLGLNLGTAPKFVKQYANLADATLSAVKAYVTDVSERKYPDQAHSY